MGGVSLLSQFFSCVAAMLCITQVSTYPDILLLGNSTYKVFLIIKVVFILEYLENIEKYKKKI